MGGRVGRNGVGGILGHGLCMLLTGAFVWNILCGMLVSFPRVALSLCLLWTGNRCSRSPHNTTQQSVWDETSGILGSCLLCQAWLSHLLVLFLFSYQPCRIPSLVPPGDIVFAAPKWWTLYSMPEPALVPNLGKFSPWPMLKHAPES